MIKHINLLENKISIFTKKYYKNKLLKGLIYILLILLISTSFITLIELFAFLSPNKKFIIIIGFFAIQFFSTYFFFIKPFLGLFGLKSNLTKKTINDLIVKHFPEIKDRLLNIFELNRFDERDLYSQELLLASIDQKIDEIKDFNFSESIRYSENLKIAVFLVLVLVIFSSVVLIFPDVIKEPGQRLINYKTIYEKPSPYTFFVLNKDLKVIKGDNFIIKAQLISKTESENLYINYGGNRYLMKRDSLNYYSYIFPTVNNGLAFKLSVENYFSKDYQINVLPKPILSSFKVSVTKPLYTFLKNEIIENITELSAPAGSKVSIDFKVIETDTLYVDNNGITYKLFNNDFSYNFILKRDVDLIISIANKFNVIDNYVSIKINSITDLYPIVRVDQLIDSTDYTRVYYRGDIEDDYGFSKLVFVTKVNNKIDTIYPIEIIKNLPSQSFFYAFNFDQYRNSTNYIEYYFEIFDNDAINGPKSSVSNLYTYKFPDIKEIFDYHDEQYQNIDEILSKSMSLTDQIKKDLEDLKFKLLNSDLSEWEKREAVRNIYSKKQDLESALKNIQDRNEELSNYMDSFSEQNNDIVEKQELIQSMLDEIMSDELRNLLDDFNKMMSNLNENLLNELKERIDISLDDLSKQLDRNIEMLKKMKLEQQLNIIVDQVKKHSEKQQELSEQLDNGVNNDDIKEYLQEEKEKVQHLKDQYSKVEKLNKELENSLKLYSFDKEFNEIEKEFNQSIQSMERNNKDRSKQSIQKNKSNMDNMASMMQQMIDAAFEEQNIENLANLIQILNNLIIFSFNQENLLVTPNNPDFQTNLFKDQKKLYSDFTVIKDSLYALAKREPSINIVVNNEIVSIENNFRIIERDLTDGRSQQAKIYQQIVMTSANNLALFMSEAIKNLQQQMANSMPGNQNCQNPGNNPNPSSMGNSLKQMQQGLQQQLEKMMQMMQDGAGQQQMSGEMGKALAEQEKMKSMLQNMMNQGNVGSNARETLKQADQLLDRVREDIIRNNISDNTVRRQQQILTRLLEAENAENEREFEEKRKSETAEKQRISETAKYFDNYISNDKFEERLLRQKLNLNRFYQQKYQSFINQLDSINGAYY
jgi:hypothetical protein